MVLVLLVEWKLVFIVCDIIVLFVSVLVKSFEQFQFECYCFCGVMEISNIDEFVKYLFGYVGDGVCCFIDVDEMCV